MALRPEMDETEIFLIFFVFPCKTRELSYFLLRVHVRADVKIEKPVLVGILWINTLQNKCM